MHFRVSGVMSGKWERHPDTLIILKYIMIKAIDDYVQSTLVLFSPLSLAILIMCGKFRICSSFYLLWNDDEEVVEAESVRLPT